MTEPAQSSPDTPPAALPFSPSEAGVPPSAAVPSHYRAFRLLLVLAVALMFVWLGWALVQPDATEELLDAVVRWFNSLAVIM